MATMKCNQRNCGLAFRICTMRKCPAYQNGLSGILSQNFHGSVGNDRAFFLACEGGHPAIR
ncbi:hypothetical protein NOVOSPHI9U_50080 [Novosphingobium sp. 9U]|nr:hypothetical protein NOVOSPHI9U_50080 [Novosphingobium sp. 9U]